MTDGNNDDWTPQETRGVPPENLAEEDRWFCMRTDENGTKLPQAPWIDTNPEGEDTTWNQPVGHNWPGVKTGYETAKEWADMVDDLYLATRIDDYDDRETHRLHLIDFDNVRDPETEEVHPQVEELIETVDSYAQVSYSGTGVHLYVYGPVPEGYKITGFETKLSDWKHSDEFDEPPHVEGYSRSRFIAITERHIDSTPENVETRPAGLELIYQMYGEEGGDDLPDEYESTVEREPGTTKEEIGTIETTGDWDVIFDAISHAKPRFDGGSVRLHSDVTNERPSGIVDLDPSWEHSESGTRLGYDDGFIYRKGGTGLDILQVVALEEHLIRGVSEYPTGQDFHDALEELRKRGAHIPEYDSEKAEKDPLATLPLARLDALEYDERVRYAKQRGIDWPSVEKVRNRLDDSITASVEHGETVVKSSPTGSGKTYTVASKPWKGMPEVTGDKPVIHAHRTHEARDQAREMSEEAGVDAYTLKGRKELCPVAAGKYDPGNDYDNKELTIDGQPISEWIDYRCDQQGLPFSHVHQWAEEKIDGDLPCQEGDTQCAAMGQFDGIPRDDNGDPSHDVIHATHQFLLVPGLRMHTHVFVDEKPSFGVDLSSERVRESVNAYLEYVDAPVRSYNELSRASKTGLPPDVGESGTKGGLTNRELRKSFEERMDEALNGQNTYVECPECGGDGVLDDETANTGDITDYPDGGERDGECHVCNGTGEVVESRGRPPISWFKENWEAHALAPAFARAIWEAEEAAGDRKHARVQYKPPRWGNDSHDERGWNRVYVDVVLDDQYEIVQAEMSPDFSLAESVIGLDAHPQPRDPYWMASVHPDIETDYTLSTEERTLYRRYERGLFTVQVGEGIQPVTSGEWLNEGQGRKFDAVIQHMADHYGDRFDSAITSIAAKERIRRSMERAGVEEPEMMHYGNEESRNDFAGKDVGLVVGSIDPGDDKVLNLCSRLGVDAQPVKKECPVCGGTGHVENDDGEPEMCETCHGTGEVRERGRTFEGDGADIADSVLQGVREHHVAQSAGRWARDADDEDDNATVFIVSEATPTGFVDAKVPGVTWTTNEDQRERLKYIRDQSDGATAKEVAEATGCSKQAAWRTLRKAEDNGLLEKTPGAGPYGADVYSPSETFTADGTADISEDTDGRNVTERVKEYSTYTVTIQSLPHVSFDDYDDAKGEWPFQSTFEWYERPAAPPT